MDPAADKAQREAEAAKRGSGAEASASMASAPPKRSIALALGARDAADTLQLCAYAATRILQPEDALTVVHVRECPTPSWARGQAVFVAFCARALMRRR
jgi:hypothetical protein